MRLGLGERIRHRLDVLRFGAEARRQRRELPWNVGGVERARAVVEQQLEDEVLKCRPDLVRRDQPSERCRDVMHDLILPQGPTPTGPCRALLKWRRRESNPGPKAIVTTSRTRCYPLSPWFSSGSSSRPVPCRPVRFRPIPRWRGTLGAHAGMALARCAPVWVPRGRRPSACSAMTRAGGRQGTRVLVPTRHYCQAQARRASRSGGRGRCRER